MTDPAIIEAAARALRDANIYDAPVWKTYHQMASAMLTTVTPLIRAAALEEAVRTIEENSILWSGPVHMVRDNIATAIRSLKEQP